MDFSSHSFLSGAAAQALAHVESTSLIPALNTLLEQQSGSGSGLDWDTFNAAYSVLAQVSQQESLEESLLETVFATVGGLTGVVEAVEAIAGQDLEQLVPAQRGDLGLLESVNGGYGQLVSLAQSWGAQARVDSLIGVALEQWVGDMGLKAGDVTEQSEPVSVMRLSSNGDGATASRQADLQVSDVVVTSEIAPGESLTVEASFHNVGNRVAGASTIRYWLSDDLVLDGADQALGAERLEALAPESQVRHAMQFDYAPTWGAGAKYVLVEADGGNLLPEHNETNNLSMAAVQLEQADLQQYWFYYSFNPANPESADSYLGSVIAPEGTYEIAPSLPGGGHDPAYGFNPTTQLTEANTDGKYLVYGKSDYNDDLVADQGKVFVLSYTDRQAGSTQRLTPNQYAQGGQPSGLNFLGSESDYLGGAQLTKARFGQDYYEADTGNPDIEIQAYTPFGFFSQDQRSAIDTAIANWEHLIVGDKDDSGVLKLAFTHTAQRFDGSSWGWVWGEAYLDVVVGERIDRDYDVVDIGGDFHNRVNYNSVKLGQLSSNQLIRLTMHEIGHALGLDEAQEDALLGLDSVMDKHGLDPKVTEGVFQRLESLGYKVNRAAANGLQWDLAAPATV